MRDLLTDLKSSCSISFALHDDWFAKELYAALSNVSWRYTNPDEELEIMDRLANDRDHQWACSWRTAGEIVAELRNLHRIEDAHEDYMSFYCSGNEGHVSTSVESILSDLGWAPTTSEEVL